MNICKIYQFIIRNGEVSGNQIGAAYMKRDRIRDIQVINKYGFLLLTPVGTSKGLEDADTG